MKKVLWKLKYKKNQNNEGMTSVQYAKATSTISYWHGGQIYQQDGILKIPWMSDNPMLDPVERNNIRTTYSLSVLHRKFKKRLGTSTGRMRIQLSYANSQRSTTFFIVVYSFAIKVLCIGSRATFDFSLEPTLLFQIYGISEGDEAMNKDAYSARYVWSKSTGVTVHGIDSLA